MSLFDASFFKRLGFYLVGFSIGLVFLAFFFKEKRTEFCYLPNCRVLKDLRSKPLIFNNDVFEILTDRALDSSYVKDFFVDGDILFNQSDTEKEPCKLYLIEKEIENKSVIMKVENCSDKVVVVALR